VDEVRTTDAPGDTPDLEGFRSELRAWLEREAPAALRGQARDPEIVPWGGRRARFVLPECRIWLDKAAERGLTAPTWPKAYGGGGLSRAQARVWTEELARLALPVPLTGFGLSMIGPTLLQYGSEAQKQLHIPRIVRGEIRWCQGYSEPNAGSDLASLQTSAVRETGPDGREHYVINGQKVWTSYGDVSDWMFLLVRTDPKVKLQAGITFLLMDLDTPGVEIRPIRLISGASPFCESFFSDVRVPVENVVGEVNAGWTVAKALLGHERSMIANVFGSGTASQREGKNTRGHRLAGLARDYVGEVEGRAADPILRDRIAQLAMDELAFRTTVQRSQDSAKAGHRPGPETSLFKVYGTELNQRREELMLSIRGPRSLGWEGEGFSEEELAQTRAWLRSRGNTIEGGTSEIQLNIIAKRVLGLPD
jgi:alkylation response protein AidB-like acyl-CoA dehydrogenase